MTKLKENNEKDVQITEEMEEIVPNCELSEEKITVETFVQTEYLSPIDIILNNKLQIQTKEKDLEQVKEAIDILCKIIGFQNLEDVMGEQEELDEDLE
jgi:hypothetical protein